MFQDVSAKLVQNITGGIAVSNLWADVQYDELTINVRQKGDNTFADLLGRVRTGSETANDLKLLEGRVIPGELQRTGSKGRRLFSENLQDTLVSILCSCYLDWIFVNSSTHSCSQTLMNWFTSLPLTMLTAV